MAEALATTERDARGLLHHARNYLGAEVLVGALGLLAFPVLSHFLTRAEWGMLELFNAVLAFSLVGLDLGLRGSLHRYTLEDSDDFPDFLRTVLVTLGVFIVFFALVFAPASGWLAAGLGIPTPIFVAAVVCAGLSLPWQLEWKLAEARQRSAYLGRMRVTRGLLLTGLAVAAVVLLPSQRHLGYVGAALIVSAGLALYVLPGLLRGARGARVRARHLRYALGFGLPALPHALAGILLVSADRAVIGNARGLEEVGLYGAAYAIGTATMMCAVALQQAWSPRFVRDHQRGDHAALAAAARQNAVLVAGVALTLSLFADEVFRIVVAPRFAAAAGVVPPIVFAYAALQVYFTYSNYSVSMRRMGLLSLATLLAAGLNLGLNLWLVPDYGYAAAAWTTLGSYGALAALHWAIARWVLRQQVVGVAAAAGPIVLAGLVVGAVALAPVADPWLRFAALELPLVGLFAFWAAKTLRA